MAINMALKRAKKAQRRKQLVAEKRVAEAIDAGLGGQIRRAAGAPIQHCLLSQALFDAGMGTLLLARGLTPFDFALGTFLLDPYCLGIKDIMFRVVDEDELEMYVETMGAASPFIFVEPSYARKLLRDLAAWARSIGFPPHRDFAAVEQLFGNVSADVCDEVFRFGRDGKPVYMPGPSEPSSLIRSRVEQLRKRFGDDGFTVGLFDTDDGEDAAPSR